MSSKHDAAREARWKERGHGRLTVRLSGAALRSLDNLCERQCVGRKDALEAILTGTLPVPANPHGLSFDEIQASRALGVMP